MPEPTRAPNEGADRPARSRAGEGGGQRTHGEDRKTRNREARSREPEEQGTQPTASGGADPRALGGLAAELRSGGRLGEVALPRLVRHQQADIVLAVSASGEAAVPTLRRLAVAEHAGHHLPRPPTFTLSSAGGGTCSFIRPSGVFTSTQPFVASTLVTSPSMVCTPSFDAICAEAVPTRGAKARSVASARVFMMCPLCRADRSASLPPLLLLAPVGAATLLAGTLPTLLLAALPGLLAVLPGLLAVLLAGMLPTLLLAALLLVALLV